MRKRFSSAALYFAFLDSLANSPLRPIRILLRIHLLDTDFQPAIFRERHVLLLHVLLAAVGELVAPQVDLVAEVGCAADDGEEDDQWEERG
jgi:hypothetical protein